MPGTGSRHPPPAFVEDYDDDAQTTLSSTRETADVAVKRSQAGLVSGKPTNRLHDDSDSGYSSKAPTVGSASTGAGKMGGLKINTSLQERERQPYIVSAGGNAVRRETFTRPRASTHGPTTAQEEPFVHPKGLCMTCDYYGKHIELPQSAVQPPTPVSPQVLKKHPTTTKNGQGASDPRLKRYSSHQSTPPVSYAQSPAVQPVYSTSPYVQTAGWSAPATQMVYTYATPLTSNYVGPTTQTSYFDPPPISEARPPNATRRSSQYGDPVIQQPIRDDKRAADTKTGHWKEARPTNPTRRSEDYDSHPSASVTRDYDSRPSASVTRNYDSRPSASVTRDYDRLPATSITRDYDSRPSASVTRDVYDDRPSASIARTYDDRPSASLTRDSQDRATASVGRDYDRVPASTVERNTDRRPQASTQRSYQSVDQDRKAMPPPARPRKQPEVVRRPSLQKSSTYNPEITHHRRSRTADDYEHVEVRAPPSPTIREAPPSSYRGPQMPEDVPSRPRPTRKSVSYTDPATTTKMYQNNAKPNDDSNPRRNTNPPTSMEHKAADAEAYQRSRSNMTSEELTAEKLSTLKKQRSNTLSSETGSAYSHRESHHSSSRGSSGRGRSHTSGHRTSILIDKGIKVDVPADYEREGRPVSIDFGGGMTLSFGSKDKDKKKEPRMIEKAPSVASHASKKSTTSASFDIPSRGRDQDESSKSTRRPSHNEDRRPPVTDRSQKTSRLHSRAPSTSRGSRRLSVDYSGGYSAY